jgi:cellulase (glycosyl hydrolase family 5)
MAVTAAALSVVAATATATAARGLRTYSTPGTAPLVTALADPSLFAGGQSAAAFARTAAAGATYVRLTVVWRAIAPEVRPDGWVPADPASPGYSWTSLDSTIAAADAAGLTPILNISNPPSWTYLRQPHGVNGGTPRASALGSFATALATRYHGDAPDAPVANVFEVWNEPNLSTYLNPVSAAAYRKMVNAVADAVHSVDQANLVVAGDLDPFGHPKNKKQKWHSVSPLTFMRSLLCVSKGPHPHATCHNQIHFDVWSHHPYTFGGPRGKAKLPNDVELGDLPRMRAVLTAGVRLHRVVSSHPVKFWVTEFGWDSKPPRPHAAPMGLAARWTAESLYQMFRSGVSLVTWFDLQDRPSPSPYQSGLYFHSSSIANARAKPVRTAFRFPFVAYRHSSTVSVWGRDATSSKVRVTIQVRHGKSGRWSTAAYVVANRNGIFKTTLRLRTRTSYWLRAVAAGSGKSLAFSLAVPHYPHIGPWGN